MTDADDPTKLIAELRARLEAATREMDELVDEVVLRRAVNDELESVVDVLLELGDTPVIVVDEERRIRGLSRAAADRLEGAAIGKPLSSAVPDELYDRLVAQLDDGPGGSESARIHPLPSGGAVLVLVGG